MPSKCAVNGELGLDTARLAWDIDPMPLQREARRSLDGASGPSHERSGGGALTLLLAILALCFAASMACRASEQPAGMGGQSGDEGRRPGSPWLGTGGVAAEPSATR